MILNKMKFSFLILFAVTFIACEKDDAISPMEIFKQDIIGNWQSQSSEFDELAQVYGFRTLEIKASTWQITIERYADEQRTTPILKLEFEGPYEIGEESSVLAGAYNGTFSFSKKTMTSYIDPVMLGLGECGIRINEAFDFSEVDCVWLESIEHCPSDFDLISFENDVLTPGKRTDNMCEENGRPIEKGFSMNRI